MTILHSIGPILAALLIGYFPGRLLPDRMTGFLSKLIVPLVWLMLFLIGFEFGEITASERSIGLVTRNAALLAALTTIGPCALVFLMHRRHAPETRTAGTAHRDKAWGVVKECVVALVMVAAGTLAYMASEAVFDGGLRLPSSSDLLLLLIVIVGIDLAKLRLDARWFTPSFIFLPMCVVLGSLIGGAVASWMLGEDLRTSLALASGFGWFTLSSILVGNHLGQVYGMTALLTDLFRELIAIILLYAFGRQAPRLGIASAGATALDSTLPIVKQACDSEWVPLALVTGFVLTVLAPILITFFIS